jgi:hypothetical protein
MKRLLLIVLTSIISSIPAQSQENIDIDFGTVSDFILFSGVGAVANTGISTITGNVGSNAGAISGFDLPTILNGTIENANPITTQASIDLTTACVQLQNIAVTVGNHSTTYGSETGETIYPGVYSTGAATSIIGTLTLDAQGDPDAMFVFKVGGALSSVAGSEIILVNGTSSDNVYWIAVGAVGLGANTTMIGTFIGYPGAVSVGAGGSLDGRLYATVGAIAIDSFEATISTSTTNPVTSGNSAGLESNGSLAYLIAKRNFNRKKEGNSVNTLATQQGFTKNLDRTINETLLIDYLPETGMYGTEIATVSSPDDLLGITNANEVFSVDYYQDSIRVSAVFATATKGSIYDHSKVICDRLNGSSLEDVGTVVARGHQIISSKIIRATGEIEYTLSFSIKLNRTENELFSFWNIDQYPSGDYQNFQIWGNSFSQVFSIANYIIDKQTIENGLISTAVEDVTPNVFVSYGVYSNGFINLNIINKTNETSIDFSGSIAETEVSNRHVINSTHALTGEYNDVLSIETGVLFDIGFSLRTDENAQKDALYLADGPWGLDYLDDYVTVNFFDVTSAIRNYSEGSHDVNRNPIVYGEVKGNINLFRHILPGDQTLDVTNYDVINFLIINNEPVELIIMQDEYRDWENRIRYVIPVNETEQGFNISFADFVDGFGNSVDITNIKTVVFSIIGDYTNYIPFNMSINELSFNTQSVLALSDVSVEKKNKLINYPNPFEISTTIRLIETSENVTIQVFDLSGRLVDVRKLSTDSDSKSVLYTIPKLASGVYKYSLKDANNKVFVGSFLVK